jgi:hypothetical protein
VFIQIHKKHRKLKNKLISAGRESGKGGKVERTKGGEGGGVGRGLGVSNWQGCLAFSRPVSLIHF